MALKQRITLIQGPPGTGKTYVGCYIVKCLTELNPNLKILCLSYTNHSVDDFCESLHKCGVTSMVRIGKKPESSVILQYNLDMIAKSVTGDSLFNARWGNCMSKLEATESTAKVVLEQLQDVSARESSKLWSYISDHLDSTGSMYFDELTVFTEEGTRTELH